MNKLTMLLIAALFLVFSSARAQDNWTHFRGSSLNGIAVDGDFPLVWNDSVNIEWMTPVEGRGWSSPVVLDEQIWITTASPEGKDMSAVCLDIESGEIIHDITLFNPETVKRIHAVNSYATPTSAIEEDFIYVHFGRYGTACINTKSGATLWERDDMICEHVQGPGSSLFLYEDKLIVHMEGIDVQDIYALDKRTGKTIWRANRTRSFYENLPDIGKKAFVTPIIIEVEGRKLLISNGSAVCNAYDIETGEEVWFIRQGEDSTISMPVEYKGKVYFYTSFVSPDEGEKYCELWCVDPKGTKDLSSNILWRMKAPILQLSTPVIHNGLLYTIDTKGWLYCIDAQSGEVIWSERLKGKYNSSLIYANGSIYASSTRGNTLVFRVGKSYQLVSENKLGGEIWATPAFVDDAIIMRTSKGVYKISNH